ncbi:MAG: chromate resistance protein [Desulfomonile sp.]|nr:chromate resistance protein [Desulfomonile sp.]
MAECVDGKWLLLIHQIPPKPAYLRVKIWRRLHGLGAVAIKNSVYVLPRNDDTFEDFQWVLKEIVQEGGEASICSAGFVEGLTDRQVEELFRTARDADYSAIVDEARAVLDSAPANPSIAGEEDRSGLETASSRLRKRFSAVVALDFFGAPGRKAAEAILEQIESRLRQMKQTEAATPAARAPDVKGLVGKTWVTRKGVYVDRIACAWLIRRFIDPDAQFRFVSSKGYRPKAGEVRFDMYEGEFTHEGSLCTFEALVARLFSRNQALAQIGQIIHDLDFKEAKFNKPETPGIGALIDGLASAHKSDEVRLERGSVIFDDLYEYLRRK